MNEYKRILNKAKGYNFSNKIKANFFLFTMIDNKFNYIDSNEKKRLPNLVKEVMNGTEKHIVLFDYESYKLYGYPKMRNLIVICRDDVQQQDVRHNTNMKEDIVIFTEDGYASTDRRRNLNLMLDFHRIFSSADGHTIISFLGGYHTNRCFNFFERVFVLREMKGEIKKITSSYTPPGVNKTTTTIDKFPIDKFYPFHQTKTRVEDFETGFIDMFTKPRNM